jgi:LemA protein
MKRTGLIILGVVAIIVIWVISARNGMATSEIDINGKWGQVQTQYNRKAKLYENIVNTIKGAARNEDTTLIKIVQMRSRVPNISPESNPQQVAEADKQLNSIGRAALSINVESYPTLQATGLYRDLQAQIEGTENRIATERRKFNEVVQDYNTYIQKFPTNLTASMFKFEKKGYFKAEGGADKAPKIEF